MTRVAIVGGGPGGLFTNYLLDRFCDGLFTATLFEASDRLGGKVATDRFEKGNSLFERGVAEFYDYSHFGPDPLKRIITEVMELDVVPMDGKGVILGDAILNTKRDIRKHFGDATVKALDAFQAECHALCSPDEYYEGYSGDDNKHPWGDKTFRDVLDAIPDEAARRYVEVASRSDVATEPQLTNALNGLKNVLMDDPKYLRLYSVVGGNEKLIDGLKERISAKVMLKSRVTKIARNADDTYTLHVRRNGKTETHVFDHVVLALPNYWVGQIEFEGREARMAIQKHQAAYDNPAHYLRVTALFKKPFWNQHFQGNYVMSDAFGGCCIYDESSRHPSKHGVLGWLITATEALALSNLDDEALIQRALDSLPSELIPLARKQFLEARVQRWVGTISGLPGGHPTPELRERHQPDGKVLPNLYLVGDYLFDSTVNGAYDSANFVVDMMMGKLRGAAYSGARKKADAAKAQGVVEDGFVESTLTNDYHDEYAVGLSYEESFREYFDEQYNADLYECIFGIKAPYTLLDVGSASGLTLECFANIGIDAWGIENNRHVHAQTPKKWLHRNLLGDVTQLPFEDQSFDVIYDTCLCYVPEDLIDKAIQELYRVTRIGIFFGGITADMTREVIEYHDVFDGVLTLETTWQWSERFQRHGWRPAVHDQKILKKAWKIECDANEGDFPWYPDMETMRYCFYAKPDAAQWVAKLMDGRAKGPTSKVRTAAAAR
ncbi:protoporphyrinogen oxidase [bacterium YEK0313]|nr:protoporphyrinogen oxidase [bacterium YEK0313]